MSDFYYVDKAEDLPKNRAYYEELNKELEKYGMDYLKVIIRDNHVYKDELHAMLGIGLELDS